MRAVIQRVKEASVEAEGKDKLEIGAGLVVTVAVARNDGMRDVGHLVSRLTNMRIFNDENGKMSQSLKDIGGDVVLVPHVSLLGDCSKGRRPSFTYVGSQKKREKFFEELGTKLADEGITVHSVQEEDVTEVTITSDGPITLLLDSKRTITFKKRRMMRRWGRRRRFYRRRPYRGRRDRYRDRGDRYRDRDDRYRDRDDRYRDRDRDDRYRDRDDRYRDRDDRDRDRDDRDRDRDRDRGRGDDRYRGGDRDMDDRG